MLLNVLLKHLTPKFMMSASNNNKPIMRSFLQLQILVASYYSFKQMALQEISLKNLDYLIRLFSRLCNRSGTFITSSRPSGNTVVRVSSSEQSQMLGTLMAHVLVIEQFFTSDQL